MKFSISITFFTLCNLLQGCISYDNAILYKKGYNPESNSELKFNGFYQAKNESEYLAPIFFYKNGSVIYSGLSKDAIELKKQILLSGQTSDYYWTDAWNAYTSSPTTINYNTVHTRLKSLLKYIMNLPDYQLQ